MALMTAGDPNYLFWRNSLAAQGLIVIGVEFRNIGGILGNHRFPAGLNDCYSALNWLYNNKEELGVSKIIISGESGGGNLSIATALKAHQEGVSDYIDGVYAQCPYISNMYNKKDKKLLSLIENDTYFLNVEAMNVTASLYDGVNSKNPLAWPYHAELSFLEGLPPHIITVNELDPLRDEGIIFYEKLKEASVNSELKIIHITNEEVEELRVGETMRLEIDWDRRYRLMKMHSALHLLCAVVKGGVTGGHISEKKSRLDFDLKVPPPPCYCACPPARPAARRRAPPPRRGSS